MLKDVKFEESYESKEYGTITMYFIAPVSILEDKYPEAESAEISVEFPVGKVEPEYASVMFSPTKDGSDYDWYDVDLPYGEIGALLNLVN